MRRALAVLSVALLLVSAAGAYTTTSAAQSEAPYVLQQGDTCVPVTPLGDGTDTVEEFYQYNESAFGTSRHDVTDNQLSQIYLYDGSAGLSLVFMHDELRKREGGSVTFRVSGLPSGWSWAVRDDYYAGRDDRYVQESADTVSIDWLWGDTRTDGGAIRGLGSSDAGTVAIDPGFGDDRSAYAKDWKQANDTVAPWVLRTGMSETVTLDRDATVYLERDGTCGSPSPTPTASPTATSSPTTTESPTPTPTPTTSPTATASPTPTASPTSPSPTPSATPTPTATVTPTPTPPPTDASPTPTATPKRDEPSTPTASPTATPTSAPEPDDSNDPPADDGGSQSGGGGVDVATPPPGEPNISLASASLTAERIAVGESVTMTATLSNTGDAMGRETVKLYIDGEYVGESRIERVPAGESVTVRVTETFERPGQYSIAFDDRTAGTLVVTAPTDTLPPAESPTATGPTATASVAEMPGSTTPTSTASGPGFGAAVVVLALLAGAVLAVRRSG